METFKKIMKKILYPRFFVVIPAIIASAVLLIYTFTSGITTDSPIAIATYVISFYTLVIVCLGIVPFIKKAKNFIYTNKHTAPFVTNPVLMAKTTLYFGLGYNLIYSAFNIFMGIWTDSEWLITLAGYYGIVAVIRFVVTRGIYLSKSDATDLERLRREWRRYRASGWISLVLTAIMSGLIAMVLFEDDGFLYPGYLIFVFAAYTFFKFVTAITNVIKFRKLDSPALSASKALNLSVAVMSLFALQTAMFAEFGSGNSMFQDASGEAMSKADIGLMNTLTGIAVWLVALCISIYMILHSTRQLKKLDDISDTPSAKEQLNGEQQ